MQHTNYSVDVPEGREMQDGYVHMRHGTQYTLRLINHSSLRCDAHAEVDGKHIGTWRLSSYGGTARLERPVDDQGRFTFYRLGSVEGAQVGLQANDSLGLIKVTFTPEKRYEPPPVLVTYEPAATSTYASTSAMPISSSYYVQSRDFQPKSRMGAGGTGLSGQSRQHYGVAGHMDLDYLQAVVIHLRLVEANNEPRPLVAASSTRIPPVVHW